MFTRSETGVEVALHLTDFGMQMVGAKYLRQHPAATDAEVAVRIQEWLLERPGAPDGDCPGRPWKWRNGQ